MAREREEEGEKKNTSGPDQEKQQKKDSTPATPTQATRACSLPASNFSTEPSTVRKWFSYFHHNESGSRVPAAPENDLNEIEKAYNVQGQHIDEILEENKANQDTISQLRAQVETMDASSLAKDMRIRELDEKVHEQEKQIQEQEGNVRKAQESAFRMLEGAQWAPEQDADIRSRINSIERATRDWSKKFALKSLGSIVLKGMPVDSREILKAEWREFAVLSSTGLPQGFDHPRMKKTGAWLLLSSWLNNQIVADVLLNPFFFLDEFMSNRTNHAARDFGQNLERLFDEYKQAHGFDSKDVHTWRSTTLRLLDPSSRAGTNADMTKLKDRVSKARHDASYQKAKDFHSKARILFDNPSLKDSQHSLLQIFEAAANLSYSLWVQKSQLTCAHMPSRFSSIDKIMEAHGLHSEQLDESEDCLNDKRILMVTHPCFLAIGDSEGDDYSKERIMKKAIVWMGPESWNK